MSDLIRRELPIEALKVIKFGLWEIDIPSATVPEYVEHHEQVKNMMEIVDGWIKRVQDEPAVEIKRAVPMIGKWTKKTGHYMTPGGVPAYVCSKCGGSEHLYGVEFTRRKVFCDTCGSVNVYPWERTIEDNEPLYRDLTAEELHAMMASEEADHG